VDIISFLHSRELCVLLSVDLQGKVYEYLKGKLHALAEADWSSNEWRIFITLVRAVKRIGLYDQLMDEQKAFYVENGVRTCEFKLKKLTDDFDDVTKIGQRAFFLHDSRELDSDN
jgi:hypothetical protein